MATGSDHRGVLGYNVQAAVDTKHHIVVANAVTNRGHDRSHLLEMATAAQAEVGAPEMIALADRGYYEGEQIRSCAEAGGRDKGSSDPDRRGVPCLGRRHAEWLPSVPVAISEGATRFDGERA